MIGVTQHRVSTYAGILADTVHVGEGVPKTERGCTETSLPTVRKATRGKPHAEDAGIVSR